jgi:hypothetical protein
MAKQIAIEQRGRDIGNLGAKARRHQAYGLARQSLHGLRQSRASMARIMARFVLALRSIFDLYLNR